jgi:hypothetical protein
VTDLFAYCLLKNHFHISIRTKSEEEILESKKTLEKETQGFLPRIVIKASKGVLQIETKVSQENP